MVFEKRFALSVLLVLLPLQAEAATGDSVSLEVRGVVLPKCSFTSVPASTDMGELQTGKASDVGPLAFTCNLATSGDVSLTLVSQNGGLKRDGGEERVAYDAAWDVQGRADDYVAVASFSPSLLPFTLTSGTGGTAQSGLFKIRVTGATEALVAGTYKDTITYTITP